MEYRQLGNSELKISSIGYGAWGIGGFPFWATEGERISTRSVQKAYDLGINFFDTAPVYGFGVSEELIGKTLKPIRDKVILATKCGLKWKKRAISSITKNTKKNSIMKEAEDSLGRLQTDWIDLYQVHWPDIETSQEETMEALLTLQEQGKIRYIGVSNYSVDQMKDCLKKGSIVSLQPEYSLIQRSIEKVTVPFCLENKIGIIAYSPLASGVLTGKYDKNTQFADWRSKGIIGQFTGQGFIDNIAKVDKLRDIANEMGKTCGDLAINWAIHQPGVTTALVGVKNSNQVEANLKSGEWKLDSDRLSTIDEIFSTN
jgi:aryl-alcohol dehydrogenase-like predicted oxidoreductase